MSQKNAPKTSILLVSWGPFSTSQLDLVLILTTKQVDFPKQADKDIGWREQKISLLASILTPKVLRSALLYKFGAKLKYVNTCWEPV